MANAYYERLSAQDASFLPYETRNTHMHITWTWIFDAGKLRTSEGGVDVERIRAYVASRLHWIPRYRQRLSYIPLENDPIWIDDDRFNIHYHVRHSALPHPGDRDQLRALTARVSSQQLDRGRPLWELWVVEGLEGGRFAIISKTHHCMVDGVSTVDLMTVLLSRTPKHTVDDAPRWIPRPAPGGNDLLREALLRRARTPIELMDGIGNAVQELREASSDLTSLSAVWNTITTGLTRAPRTPLNAPIGPHRRVQWLSMDLDEVKDIKNRLGGTVNDVVLAIVAGAVRAFFKHRQFFADDVHFKVVVPVSVRPPEERGTLGNRASAWVTELPIHIADPATRLARVREATADLKESREALGAELMIKVADFAGSNLMSLGVGVMSRLLRPYNLIVTNIPGSQDPFYLLEAQMLEGYPLVPLFANQGLGIALTSYVGRLHWGLNADWDLLPDLDTFAEALQRSFEELKEAAAATAPRKAVRSRRAKAAARGRDRAQEPSAAS